MVLHKLLPQFFLPMGISLMLIAYGLARGKRRPIGVAFVLLLLASNPLIARQLFRYAEHHAVRLPATAVQTADAIVVLSAGRTMAPGPVFVSEWDDPDRFFGGIELWRAGKAPAIVFTRPALRGQPAGQAEGDILGRLAVELGVPADRIGLTGPVSNTADEAAEVALWLQSRGVKDPRVLLVTSAFHMPRASQQFEAAGLLVVPFPVDFRSLGSPAWSPLDFVPSTSALRATHTALREFYGRAFYRLFG